MKVAIIADWLVTYAGAERCLEQIIRCYPEADLFALVDFIPEGKRDWLMNKKSRTTFIQHLPFAKTKYRSYLPLMPLAIEQLDLTGYDMVISTSHAVAKGVMTGPDQLHLCYIYSPMRYAWDLQHQYLRESGLDRGLMGWLARWSLHKLRIWDLRSAAGVDHFYAISHYISRRIQRCYRRESSVIYPPVAIQDFVLRENKEDFYFTASRMVPYKKIDLIVEAFSRMPDKRLIVIGDGPDFKKIAKLKSPNVTLLGYQPFGVLKDHLQRAKAFVFAAEEDFGIAPLEAQACGTPVIAFGKGATTETIMGLDRPEPSGLFFDRQEVESLVAAVELFEKNAHRMTPQACRKNSERFSPEIFREQFTRAVNDAWADWKKIRPL